MTDASRSHLYNDPSKITFVECVRACQSGPFPREWARLRKISLSETAIDRLVNTASSHRDAVAELFLKDVRDLVWERISPSFRGDCPTSAMLLAMLDDRDKSRRTVKFMDSP